jgi:hypothetical protein
MLRENMLQQFKVTIAAWEFDFIGKRGLLRTGREQQDAASKSISSSMNGN